MRCGAKEIGASERLFFVWHRSYPCQGADREWRCDTDMKRQKRSDFSSFQKIANDKKYADKWEDQEEPCPVKSVKIRSRLFRAGSGNHIPYQIGKDSTNEGDR